MKNCILKGITVLALFTILIVGAALDTFEHLALPIGIIIVCLAWCFIFYAVNEGYFNDHLN